MKNGQGIWKKSGDENSNEYNGEYKNDMKHGFGVFTWQSGSRYKGQYKKDVKCGYGEMLWSDGSVYRGFWINGLQEGIGMMIFQNGMKKAGTFKENIYIEPISEKEQVKSLLESKPKDKALEIFIQELETYIEQLPKPQPKDDDVGK